jgi:hypothetical protein
VLSILSTIKNNYHGTMIKIGEESYRQSTTCKSSQNSPFSGVGSKLLDRMFVIVTEDENALKVAAPCCCPSSDGFFLLRVVPFGF